MINHQMWVSYFGQPHFGALGAAQSQDILGVLLRFVEDLTIRIKDPTQVDGHFNQQRYLPEAFCWVFIFNLYIYRHGLSGYTVIKPQAISLQRYSPTFTKHDRHDRLPQMSQIPIGWLMKGAVCLAFHQKDMIVWFNFSDPDSQ